MQEAIGLVFREFAEFESIRQVRQEQVLLPSVETAGELRRGRLGRIVWKLPVDNSGRGLLTNPVYGGAYAFGRTASRVTVENGRKRVSRGRDPDRKEWRDRKEWDVLIVDHHAAAGCGVPAAPHHELRGAGSPRDRPGQPRTRGTFPGRSSKGTSG